MTVPAQRDERVRRTGRPARPTRGLVRRALRVARRACLVGALVCGGYQAAVLLLAAPSLAVADIVVRGNTQLSEGEVLALVSGLRGASILAVDLETHRRRLTASPWLLGGTLRRILPSTIEVFVTERRPVGVARFADQLFLVDASGVVIDQYGPRFASFDLPIIDGLAGPGGPTEAVWPARMALATRLLEQLARQPAVLDAISQIDVADPYDAVVLLNDDPALLHLGTDQFLERLRFYAELAPTLRARVDAIDYVDLRFDQRVYVKPHGRTASTTNGGIDRLAQTRAVGQD